MDNQKKQDLILQLGYEYIRVGLVGDRTPRKTLKSGDTLKWNDRSKEKFALNLQQLLYDIFFVYVNCACAGKTIIILQRVYTDRRILEVMTNLLFSKFKVEKVESALTCITPLYLTGQYTGIVVSAGASAVEIMPVFESFPITSAFVVIPIGTMALNQLVRNELMKNNQGKNEIIQNISEEEINQIRYVYQNNITATEPVIITHKKEKLKYVPVGVNVFFSRKQQVILEQDKGYNIGNALLQSLSHLPEKCIEEVCKNIVLSGGMWRIKGMQKQFKKSVAEEIKKFPRLQKKDLKNKLSFVSWSFNPSEIAWIGCTIGASIRNIEHLSLTKSDYLTTGYVQKIMDTYFM